MSAWPPASRSTWTPADIAGTSYPPGFAGLVIRLWEQHEVAPGTWLGNIEQTVSSGHPDFACDIVAPLGKPVSRIEITDIAARYGVPTLCVAAEETEHGPGRLRLSRPHQRQRQQHQRRVGGPDRPARRHQPPHRPGDAGSDRSRLPDRLVTRLAGVWHDWTMLPPTGKDDDGSGPTCSGAGVGAGIGSFGPPPVPKPRRTTVKDQVLDAVDREMTAKEIRGLVDAAADTVRDALSDLVADGQLLRVDHGAYAPVPTGTAVADDSGTGSAGVRELPDGVSPELQQRQRRPLRRPRLQRLLHPLHRTRLLLTHPHASDLIDEHRKRAPAHPSPKQRPTHEARFGRPASVQVDGIGDNLEHDQPPAWRRTAPFWLRPRQEGAGGRLRVRQVGAVRPVGLTSARGQ
ncbi:hypothetical protein ACFV0T_38305 [Streptomyces sp. NPDC059582]|uniref:hypothetical protein n=1 Tax=Streptomyces sp. NPDC059582 TaxID=3346875 RepID=UPI00368D5E73